MAQASPTNLRIVLTISSLGDIPEHQQTSRTMERKVTNYFDNGLSDGPMCAQLSHFGHQTTVRMVSNELKSWLESLGTVPTIETVTHEA